MDDRLPVNSYGRFPFDRMIKTYSMEQLNQAAEDSEKGRVLKAIVRP